MILALCIQDSTDLITILDSLSHNAFELNLVINHIITMLCSPSYPSAPTPAYERPASQPPEPMNYQYGYSQLQYSSIPPPILTPSGLPATHPLFLQKCRLRGDVNIPRALVRSLTGLPQSSTSSTCSPLTFRQAILTPITLQAWNNFKDHAGEEVVIECFWYIDSGV